MSTVIAKIHQKNNKHAEKENKILNMKGVKRLILQPVSPSPSCKSLINLRAIYI